MNGLRPILFTFLLILSFAALACAETPETSIIYITDVSTPFPVGAVQDDLAAAGIHVTVCRPDGFSELPDGSSATSADILLTDLRSPENRSTVSQMIADGRLSGKLVAFTKENGLFTASVAGGGAAENEAAAKYWTRHPENMNALLRLLARSLDGRTDLPEAPAPVTDLTDPANRTSILLVVTPNNVSISGILDTLQDYGIDAVYPDREWLQYSSTDPEAQEKVSDAIRRFDGDIILEIVGPELNKVYNPIIAETAAKNNLTAIVADGFNFNKTAYANVTLPDGSGADIDDIKSATAYWDCVLPENLRRMFIKIACAADGRADLAPLVLPSMTVPEKALYHPAAPPLVFGNDAFDHLLTDRAAYNDWYLNRYKPEKGLSDNGKWIAVSSYYRDYQEGKMHTEDMMIEKLEAEGYNVVVVYHKKVPVTEYFSRNPEDGMPVDVFISFQTFGYNQYLKEYGCPVLNAVSLSGGYLSLEEWQNDQNGLKKSTYYYKIDQSEVQGSVFPIGVEIQMDKSDQMPYPIEDRVDRLLGQAMNYADLRTMPNGDKKVALIYFNHPPGKQNIGASYLNLFDSLEKILSAMAGDGYTTTPMTSDALSGVILTGGRNVGGWAPGELEKLVDDGMADGSIVLLPVSTYEQWTADLSAGEKKVIDDITAEWGAPGESDFMTVTRNGDRYFVFPVIFNGNVAMMPEPARGWEEDIEKLYHDMNIPTPHQYAAFYLWLQKPEEEGGFGADAVVRIGRHGTQEFLPGKMICMDETSAADLMIGNIPNMYIYIVDGSGEGLQAKRRGYATLISHLTPPIAQSGLNDELSGLSELIVGYDRAVSGGNDRMKDEYRKQILMLLKNSSAANYLAIDPALSENCTDEEFSETVESVASYLEILSAETMPYGTHIFGGVLPAPKAAMFVETVYYDRLADLAAPLLGVDKNTASYPEKTKIAALVSDLSLWIAESDDSASFEKRLQENAVSSDGSVRYQVPDDLSAFWSAHDVSRSLISSLSGVYETQGLLDGLAGRYVPISPQGDPVRNPEVLPTGRNYVGFVSNTVPTAAASSLGRRLADEMIASYYNETGAFPEKIGVTLWSVETFRHDGVMEALTLRLMGAEPFLNVNAATGKPTGTVNNTKVNVTEEADLTILTKDGTLLRPRVDVVITISGLYRDTLPYQIRMIDKAVSTIAAYDGDASIRNYVREHSLAMEAELRALEDAGKQKIADTYAEAAGVYDGDYEALARQLSCIRIFGPPPESYGTGIEKEIEAGRDWTSETAVDKIGGLYIFRMANMYTVSSAGDILFLGSFDKIFTMNLKGISVVTNSRSSHLYGILDNDDFFQYVGGMSMAVQSLDPDKKPPQTLIVNLRKEGAVQTLSEFLKKELLSRPLNEKYQEGMIESGYSGMKELSEIVDNLWGWQVTTPHAVDNYMWNDVYGALVMNESVREAFRNSNPYAYASMVTRMIDANVKGYWDADKDIVGNLAKELAQTVVESGVACCHHTCGNPTLNDQISGLLSVPGVCDPDVARQWRELTEAATGQTIRNDTQNTSGHKTSGTSGTGRADIRVNIPDASRPPEENEAEIPKPEKIENDTGSGVGSDQNAPPGQTVSGYEMVTKTMSDTVSKMQEFLKNPTFSAASMIAILFVIAVTAVFFYGYRRRGL